MVWLSGRPPAQQANAAAEVPAGDAAVGEKPAGEALARGVSAARGVAAPPLTIVPISLPPAPTPLVDTRTEAPVLPGDNLGRIFERHALNPRDLHLVVASGALGRRLASIHPGHRFEFERDGDGNLVFLSYSPGPLETVEFHRVGDAFEGARVPIEPDVTTKYARASIESSLFLACQRAGLGDAFAVRLAEIFQWDIDFILDVRAGDEFHVLYEEQHVDGKSVGSGAILAAEFVNRGRSHKAVRYDSGSGPRYYAPDGASMRKTFLRAPLQFNRVSSNFNLRRVHPLWKSSMPHRGIDYAAPRGTPVQAAGEGVVVTASRTEANGNYIVLRHGERYQTKYLHLAKFHRGIRRGRYVDQGDVIGYVGATGWATGPHLHYEFLDRGVHKNPRTVALPKAAAIAADDLPAFRAATAPYFADLARHRDTPELAYAAH